MPPYPVRRSAPRRRRCPADRTAADDIQRLRVARFGDEELRAAAGAVDPLRLDARQHRHRLGGGGRLVQQRGVRDFHPRQIADHRLEVEERFQAALRNLRLIRGVRRVPAGVLENVAENHTRRDAVVIAETEKRSEQLVARGRAPQFAEELVLALAAGQVQRLLEADARRDRLVDQRVERRGADGAQHGVAFVRVGSDVAGLERFESECHRPDAVGIREWGLGIRTITVYLISA